VTGAGALAVDAGQTEVRAALTAGGRTLASSAGAGVARLGAALNDRYRRLDVLVGNAGILGPLSPLGHVPPKEWDDVIAVNVTANWHLIRSMDPLFRPVDNKTAPDGTMYIVDMYHGIIQEGEWTRKGSYLREQIDALEMEKHTGRGRIYRLTHEGFERGPAPRFAGGDAAAGCAGTASVPGSDESRSAAPRSPGLRAAATPLMAAPARRLPPSPTVRDAAGPAAHPRHPAQLAPARAARSW